MAILRIDGIKVGTWFWFAGQFWLKTENDADPVDGALSHYSPKKRIEN